MTPTGLTVKHSEQEEGALRAPRAGGRKEARFVGVAATGRARCVAVCVSQPPPSMAPRLHQPSTFRRETGRRCPLRRGPQCCGRGEAAGNCASTDGAFSTAHVDRIPHILGMRPAAAPESPLRPGSTGRLGQDYKTRHEFKGRRTQGGEQRVRGRRRHRTPKLCRTRARRIHRRAIVTIASDADPGATARS